LVSDIPAGDENVANLVFTVHPCGPSRLDDNGWRSQAAWNEAQGADPPPLYALAKAGIEII
jgi:hypothetical protein